MTGKLSYADIIPSNNFGEFHPGDPFSNLNIAICIEFIPIAVILKIKKQYITLQVLKNS